MQNWAEIEIVYQGLKSKEQAATIIYIQNIQQLSPPEFIQSNQGGTTSTCTIKFSYFLNASLKRCPIYLEITFDTSEKKESNILLVTNSFIH